MNENETLDKVITGALIKVGVTHPPFLNSAKEKFTELATTKKDSDILSVINEWAKTEDIKKYLLAPINSGGGSMGGGGHRHRNDEQNAADWDLWAFIPQCEHWQAVALSLDIEPPENSYQVKGWPSEYDRRLKITSAHIECKSLPRSKTDFDKVDLIAFSVWAQSLGWSLPDRFPRGVVVQTPAAEVEAAPITQAGTAPAKTENNIGEVKPWEVADPKDPAPAQPWYTPARYFARQLVINNSTLLNNRNLLAQKTSQSLFNAGIFGRTRNKALDAGTILKAFNNISLG